jgi:(2R)-3-sulfolactate dehydrogenase (NADP+)
VSRTVTLAAAEELALRAMLAAGFAEAVARPAVAALLLAERDGLASHGLQRLPFYLEQARAGKVRADAVPVVETDGAVVRVDAGFGLAFAAIEQGLDAGTEVARRLGVAAVAIGRSHHFGVAGHPVERLARDGLIGLAFSNSPAAMAPWGGKRALFGTNPIAFGAPRPQAEPLVVDLSLSRVARGKVMIAAKRGDAIPEGWALDADGVPTTDPAAALKGTMIPAGQAKGAALALVVELLCAGLTGSNFAYEASSFFDAEGPPPGIGHLILVLDPGRFDPGRFGPGSLGGHFAERGEAMLAAVEAEDGARLPGSRRAEERAKRGGVLELPEALVAELEALGRAES